MSLDLAGSWEDRATFDARLMAAGYVVSRWFGTIDDASQTADRYRELGVENVRVHKHSTHWQVSNCPRCSQ